LPEPVQLHRFGFLPSATTPMIPLNILTSIHGFTKPLIAMPGL
jgi:hypothetical protein